MMVSNYTQKERLQEIIILFSENNIDENKKRVYSHIFLNLEKISHLLINILLSSFTVTAEEFVSFVNVQFR